MLWWDLREDIFIIGHAVLLVIIEAVTQSFGRVITIRSMTPETVGSAADIYLKYRKVYNIRRTNSQNFNVSGLIL